jgi:hypothetical protein
MPSIRAMMPATSRLRELPLVSMATSRMAATGGILAARRAGKNADAVVTMVPTSMATMNDAGSSLRLASSIMKLESPLASSTPRL